MNWTGAEREVCEMRDVRKAEFDITDMESAWMFIACQQLRDQRQLELAGVARSRLGDEGRNA